MIIKVYFMVFINLKKYLLKFRLEIKFCDFNYILILPLKLTKFYNKEEKLWLKELVFFSFFMALAMLLAIIPMSEASASYSGVLQFDANGKFTIMQIADVQDNQNTYQRLLMLSKCNQPLPSRPCCLYG
jgi:hypothetical protein